MVNHEVFYYLSNECVHIDPEQISIKTARELLVRHPYLQHLRMKEFELSVLKSLWLWEDCPILSLQLDKCSRVHMHLSPSHQLQSRRRTCRTLILFTAFSSVYSYRTKWLTVSLLSCPQRHMDILSLTELGFTSYTLIGSEQRPALILQPIRKTISLHS